MHKFHTTTYMYSTKLAHGANTGISKDNLQLMSTSQIYLSAR